MAFVPGATVRRKKEFQVFTMSYLRDVLVDFLKNYDRIKELQKIKHLPPSPTMSVKLFKSYKSLKLISQKSVEKKLVFLTVFNAYSTINIS